MAVAVGNTVGRALSLSMPHRWDRPFVSQRGDVVLPVGTVTLLLGDIEGSTHAWEERAEEMSPALARVAEVVDEAVRAHEGVRPLEQGEGDSFVSAFSKASDAVICALEIQQRLAGSLLRLRAGIHTGEVQLRDEGNYMGPALNRAARLRDAAHGGQVVLSQAACELVRDRLPDGAALRDLGLHRLKDLGRPEHVSQLLHRSLADDFPPLRSVDHVPNNLPVQLTSFVGREPELAVLDKLLGETRMLTLTGAGGCGKTRLALELAAKSLDSFPDGAWFVDLAPVTDPKAVASVVATEVSARGQQGRRIDDVLIDQLGSQTALLVLDNCEHVVAAAARLTERLLVACVGLTVLATSREQLGVAGETAWQVPSLSFPDERRVRGLDVLTEYEAVQLFVERARMARPNFSVDDAAAAAIAAICHRLDGIPLAVELAAARTRVLSPQQILEGLDDRFRLLTGGARTAVARQQTLRASVDWGYQLLSEPERLLLARLSVFAGRFSLDAAEAVGAIEPIEPLAILDLLQSLADKSLLIVEDSSEGARYRMLQTIRQSALEQLGGSDERLVRDRHCKYYVGLAERAAPALEGAEQEIWSDRLEAERQNLRAAFDWAYDQGDAQSALRLVATLFWHWVIRGHLGEAAKLTKLAMELRAGAPPEVRGPALVAACHIGWFRVDPDVMPLAQEAVQTTRDVGDRWALGRALYHTGLWAGPGGRARPEDLETSIAIAREVGDRWGLAMALTALGTALSSGGRPAVAAPVLEEALAVCDELGERYIANSARYNLARSLESQGHTAEAEAMLHVVIAHARSTDDMFSLTMALGDLGVVRAFQGHIDGGIRLLEEDMELLDRARQPWPNQELQAFGVLGQLLWMAGRFEESRAALETALAKARAMSPLADDIAALTLSLLAEVDQSVGHTAPARAKGEEALGVIGEATGWSAMATRHHVARVAASAGDLDTAERLAHEALALAAEKGNHYFLFSGTVYLLDTLAVVSEDTRRAARLLGAVDELLRVAGHARDPHSHDRYEAALARLQEELGSDQIETALGEGRGMSLEEAIGYAQRGRGRRRRPSSGWESLTPTEVEVVKLVVDGLSNPEIAQRLFISRKTVTTHLTHVFAKLTISSRAELSAEAVRHGTERKEDGLPT